MERDGARPSRRRPGTSRLPLALLLGVLGAGALAAGAEPPTPSAVSSDREAELEARVRQLEALIKGMPDPQHVRRLESTVESLSTQVRQLNTRLERAEGRGTSARSSSSKS